MSSFGLENITRSEYSRIDNFITRLENKIIRHLSTVILDEGFDQAMITAMRITFEEENINDNNKHILIGFLRIVRGVDSLLGWAGLLADRFVSNELPPDDED